MQVTGPANAEPDLSPRTPLATDRCPRKLHQRFVSMSTGQSVPARCGAHFCGYCGPRNAYEVAKAISMAEPRRAIVWTDLGSSYQQRRNRMKVLVHRLRQEGYEFQQAWHVEANPSGDGRRHAHGWQFGDFVPQRQLQRVAKSVGAGIPFIQAVRQQVGRGGSVNYGLKALAYGLKGAQAEATMYGYLEDNGGRLVHASRGFWRDGDETGLTLAEMRRRVRAAAGDGVERDEGPWVLVTSVDP